MEPELPVALELRFVEELIAHGRVVREHRLPRLVLEHVGRLVARDGRFQVEQRAPLLIGIRDVADDAVDGGLTGVFDRLNASGADGDLDTEIRPALPDGIAQAAEGQCAVLFCVAGDDEAAAPAHQLVHAEVLEMPAVREVHEVGAIVGEAEQLVDQVQQAAARARAQPVVLVARVAHPPAGRQDFSRSGGRTPGGTPRA
ncbi:MAG: hypothetical protein ACREUZ_09145 [Burkholderiales bacterium]